LYTGYALDPYSTFDIKNSVFYYGNNIDIESFDITNGNQKSYEPPINYMLPAFCAKTSELYYVEFDYPQLQTFVYAFNPNNGSIRTISNVTGEITENQFGQGTFNEDGSLFIYWYFSSNFEEYNVAIIDSVSGKIQNNLQIDIKCNGNLFPNSTLQEIFYDSQNNQFLLGGELSLNGGNSEETYLVKVDAKTGKCVEMHYVCEGAISSEFDPVERNMWFICSSYVSPFPIGYIAVSVDTGNQVYNISAGEEWQPITFVITP